jgi:branched-chain amino acid transport system ATP-binding protein
MVLSPATLEVQGLSVSYGYSRAVQDVSFSIDPGRCVGIVGANGAGKSSILRSIGGLVRPSAGRILFDGHDLRGSAPWTIARKGVRLVPETRELFADLTVAENLRAGAQSLRRSERASAVQRVLDTFPRLTKLLTSRARVLSGGEQQMLAIGRALAGRPCLLLLDEPALGLAPTAIRPLADALQSLKADGLSILVAEQSLAIPLRLCDQVMICLLGRVIATGHPKEILTVQNMGAAFLGREARAEGGTS